jgi:hypothetical protein
MKLDYNEAQWRIEAILRAAGVKVKIGGCGCCSSSPYLEAEFPDGATADLDCIRIDTDRDLPDQEG